jgi:hypothetical protein
MNTDRNPSETRSPGCSGCPIEDCRAADGPDASLPSGWRLVLAAMALFLGPGVLAILGAACFPESRVAQFAGAIVGLGAGMAASVAALKRFHRAGPTESKAARSA